MFTGIIEELGILQKINRGADSAQLVISARKILEDMRVGDSVAVNGVCLTAAAFSSRDFAADVMAETLSRTDLGRLKPGYFVNLERSVRLGDRLGGHLVSGHIDGTGTIVRQEKYDIAVVVTIQAPAAITRYLIEKGSVAVDGISLTVVEVTGEQFSVSLIPHTARNTTLGHKKIGHTVNLEADIIGKYVEKFLDSRQETGRESKITLDFLAEHGFA
ncbi:MAG: riboflavin synthase [Peptococcaceae bacterium]|nr:MAG: riboflavin synthase [Peptococcaceae bacterium]